MKGDSVNELTHEPPPLRVDRRRLLRLGLFASIGALGAGAIASLARFLWPRDDTPADYLDLPLSSLPKPGDDPIDRLILLHSETGDVEVKAYVVNLRPDEGLLSADEHSGRGIIVFSRKCPHEGCTVSWRGEYRWEVGGATGTGAFRCPCCGGSFTRAGVKFFGPPPRNLDTYELARHGDSIRLYAKRLHKGTPPGSPPDPAMIVSVPA